jgi:hypothetical protein
MRLPYRDGIPVHGEHFLLHFIYTNLKGHFFSPCKSTFATLTWFITSTSMSTTASAFLASEVSHASAFDAKYGAL